MQNSGYQPTNKLDTSRPPSGGSAVPSMKPEWGCGNVNLYINCRYVQCKDCDLVRERRKQLSEVKLQESKTSEIFTEKEFIIWLKGFVEGTEMQPTMDQWYKVKLNLSRIKTDPLANWPKE